MGRVAYTLGNYDDGQRLLQKSLAIQQAGNKVDRVPRLRQQCGDIGRMCAGLVVWPKRLAQLCPVSAVRRRSLRDIHWLAQMMRAIHSTSIRSKKRGG